jgi:DNA mismatch endonuclease (patch repair protein)
MTDIVSPDIRSKMMSGIGGKNTKPEIIVRKSLHRRGFRYTLHRRDLPGKPDLTLPKYKTVVFVNGCFWHGHDCHLFKWPKTNENFWKDKINGNKVRDKNNINKLLSAGWNVLLIWECSVRSQTGEHISLVADTISDWIRQNKYAADAPRLKHIRQ